ELPVGTDLQVVRQKFNQMHNEFLMQIDGVSFSPAMKQQMEEQLEELKAAYALLNESESMDDSASLPRTERTFDYGGGETQSRSSEPEPSKPKEQQVPPPPPPSREETYQPREQAPPVYSAPPEKKKSNAGLFVGIAVMVAVMLGGFYFLANRNDVSEQSRTTISETAVSKNQQAYVTDLIGLLDASQVNALDQELISIHERTGNQISIILEDYPLSGEDDEQIDFESFATEKANQLLLGGQANVAMVASLNIRSIRLFTDTRAPQTLNDAECQEIIENQIKPHFRQQDYYKGLSDAVVEIEKQLGKG